MIFHPTDTYFGSNWPRSDMVSSLLLLLVAGCGGGGGSSDPNTPSDDILTGQFVDSPVSGLNYYTDTIQGVTDENGNFQYRPGETIVFGLGDLEFPAVTAAQILTPLELAGVEDINDTGVTNMARLLQTLDNDCDASNGIVIGGEVLLATAGMSIDFESDTFDDDVQGLIASESSAYSTCDQLVSASDAIAHLQESLNALNGQEDPPLGGGLEGKLGVWEGEGQQDTGNYSWTIKITITKNEQLIEYPSLECGGTLTLLEESDAQLIFRETITYMNNSNIGCYDQGFVELTDQNVNSLVYRWFFPDDNNDQGELDAVGTVTKVE